ncbi:hypothetical protein PPERSA_11584 [Pseudocohnilembus persalinus]|uniref:Uncharacterized protein n=1 Tax=Pseudocohnilembus persalinus TaxID=266149 RepID=A0A0V0QA85_PSEPJ|nr:hypothetical protein PPERSA_11584 [Pseudocohnilembus persalinus]|eukprot:KRW98983.1 hypothetical protein PPERSA_11584 [Pseudocohnilembus persalinus]
MSKETNREAQQIFQNLNTKQSLNSRKKSRNSVKSPQNNILEVLKQDYKQPEQNPYYLKNENLDKFENFDGKFLRENRAELVIEEESYDLENFTISSSVLEKPPIEINPSRELVYFLENNVIRAIEQPKLREKYIQLIGQPRTSKMIQFSFWFILLTKFPGCLDVDDKKICQNLL